MTTVPELRYDPTTDAWVVVASERAARRQDFSRSRQTGELPEHDLDCPFCPGNEHMTPPATLVLPGPLGWQVRVVPNKHPLVGNVVDLPRPPAGPPAPSEWYTRYAAPGAHEVAIVSPSHRRWLPALAPDEAVSLAHALRERYRALAARRTVRQVLIFENHGPAAGASLAHPHVQIVGLPIVTPFMRRRCAAARRYAECTGRSLWPDLLAAELATGERIVAADEHVVLWTPFASCLPFEIWLAPRRPQPSFGQVEESELTACALTLRATLAALERVLGAVDVNYIVHSAPAEWGTDVGLSWFVQVLPRTTTPAGFELGGGLGVTTTAPEAAAALLRAALSATDPTSR